MLPSRRLHRATTVARQATSQIDLRELTAAQRKRVKAAEYQLGQVIAGLTDTPGEQAA